MKCRDCNMCIKDDGSPYCPMLDLFTHVDLDGECLLGEEDKKIVFGGKHEMKRTIKFRAWDCRSGRYVYDVEHSYDYGCRGEYADDIENCFGDYLDDNNYIVEQFTGVKDNNGKDIYEGDIVSNGYGNFSVSYNWVGMDKQFDSSIDKEIPSRLIDKSFEVVGNIHENKELIDEHK